MARRTIIRKEGTPLGSWMVTFSDMNTLLLTFFVMMFSMSSTTSEGFMEFFREFTGDSLGLFQQGGLVGSGELMIDPIPEIQSDPTRSLLGILTRPSPGATEGSGLPTSVEVIFSDAPNGAVTFILAEGILFEPGSDEINAQAADFLDRMRAFLANVLILSNRNVLLEGHSDDSIPSEGSYLLSARRATAVLSYLLRDGTLPPGRFSVVGYGSTRPRVPNDSAENRARNRRVSIVVEPPDASIFNAGTL